MVSHAFLDRADEAPGGRHCPFCDFLVRTVREEVAHMEEEHADIIENRLRAAGLYPEAEAFALEISARRRARYAPQAPPGKGPA